MKLLRTIAVTFAQYSRIPMPHFEWRKEDMTYSMAAFPLVGAVIGLIYTAVFFASVRLSIPPAATALLMTAVPVLLTGGFHIDGFMDVSDALSSYADREEKLRILKDPHIGAFAVIRLALCGLIYVAAAVTVATFAYAASDLSDSEAAPVLCTAAGFILSRSLSALSVLTFKSAKKEGMLYYEAQTAGEGRTANIVIVVIWMIAAFALMLRLDLQTGILGIVSAGCVFAWYRHMSYKHLGGITGDTAGWLVTVCETALIAASAVSVIIMQQ